MPRWALLLQGIAAAVVAAGTKLATITFVGKLAWINDLGPALMTIGGGAIVGLQFLERVEKVIIDSGEGLVNDSAKPVEVAVATDDIDKTSVAPIAPADETADTQG